MESIRYKRNISKIFAITFLNSIIFAYVIERVFEASRGLSVLQMQYLFITYSAILLVLEVPFGVLADKWKRKYVWALGVVFSSLWFLLSIFARDFNMFFWAYVMTVIVGSLKSGTWDSILYQSLYKLNRRNEYEKMRGYIKLIDYTTNGVIGIIGGYIAYKFGLATNYWLSLIRIPLIIYLILSLYEPCNKVKIDEGSRINQGRVLARTIDHIRQSIRGIQYNRYLIHIIFYGGIIGAILYGQLHEISSLVYPKIGIPIYLFGFIGFASTLLGGLSGVIGARLKEKFGYNLIFTSVIIVSTLCIFMFSKASQGWEVIYLVIAIFIMEMIHPLTSGYLHNNITDEYRATVSSIQGFVLNGLTIIVGLVVGYFADKYSIFEGFSVMAYILAIYGVLYIVISKLKKSKSKNNTNYKATNRMELR